MDNITSYHTNICFSVNFYVYMFMYICLTSLFLCRPRMDLIPASWGKSDLLFLDSLSGNN